MPDNTPQYLDAFFKGLNMLQQGVNGDMLGQRDIANLQLQRQKMYMETAQHAQDMQQRAQQFAQEQQFRDTQLNYMKQDREAQVRDAFTKGGGYFAPTPKDTTKTNVMASPNMGTAASGQSPLDFSSILSAYSTNTNTPTTTSEPGLAGLASGQQLANPPVLPPVAPTQSTVNLPAAFQGPQPTQAMEVPALPGQAEGMTAYQKTPQALASEKAQGETIGNTFNADDVVGKALGVPVGTPIDRRLLPTLIASKDREVAEKDRLAQAATNEKDRGDRQREAEQARQDNIRLMAMLKAEKSSDEDYAPDIAKSVRQTGDVSKVPSKMVGPVTRELAKDGLPLPAALSNNDKDRETGAMSVKGYLTGIQKDLSDPDIANAIGPYMGRLDELGQLIGSGKFQLKDPLKQAKLQSVMTKLNNVVASEVRTQIGGRASNQMFDAFKKTSPNVHMDVPMFMGALNGVKQGANNTLLQLQHKRWGDKETPEFKQQMASEYDHPVDAPPSAWTNTKDNTNYIPLGTIKSMPDPDHPGQKVLIHHSIEDGKFYVAKDE